MLRTVLAFCCALLAHLESGAAKADDRLWKERSVLDTPGWLPGSVAWSSDGRMMVVGGTGGNVIGIEPATAFKKIWKADVGGDFAAVVFTADGKSIVATFNDGIRFLDAASGEPANSIEQKESRPVAVGVFPDLDIGDEAKLLHHKVIFGNASGSFVKSWFTDGPPGTIELSVVAKDKTPVDPHAVPLAVDPAGRSVILTGPPRRETGRNVLWAWVAGNYDEGSPGNRLMEGHAAVVVSAAWSKDGKTVATGDSAGHVILWNAKTMQETRRLEFGTRVAALALSNGGESIAAVAVGKKAEFFIWETAKPQAKPQPIHVESADFSGPIHACVAFSPDGKQLAGSAINTDWLARTGDVVGKLRVWQTEKLQAK